MEGYMAVTGPNGSGKSNITDAILFVLGPKSSKAIRAGKLTDLIFDGGKTKAGKASYTKVSLVFDNSDGILPWNDTTVRLTRLVKMHPNGEDYSSTFYINDQKSTMGEFDSLLSRARISADGYNMVQQGDVTRIVQMGAIERRRVLDSISGIASYDADINKAQVDKSEAEANLDRINIIKTELEHQLDALEKDMEAAKKYMEYQNRHKMAKAQLLYKELENEKSKIQNLQEELNKIQEDIVKLTERKTTLVTDIQEYVDKIADVESRIEARAGPEYRKVKEDIEQVKINQANLNDRIERAIEENGELEEDIANYKEEISELEQEIQALTRDIQENQMNIDEKNELKAQADAKINQINKQLLDLGGESKELQEKLDKLERDIDKKGEEETKITAEVASIDAKNTELSRALSEAEELMNTADFEIKDLEWALNEAKREGGATDQKAITQKILDLKKKEADLEKQEGELMSASSRLSNEYNELNAEKKVSERMRGSEAVNTILEMRDKGELKGIHGTIAELGSVDPQYETALSIAAGNKMQAIVVDDDAVAATAIEILKKKNVGRATFLPLSKMHEGKPRPNAIMVKNQTEGYAIDLLDFDEKYRAAFWYVFADTLVTKTLDKAREIMRGIRIVTLGGELIDPSGAMTGGVVNKNLLKFGAASESKLEEIGKELRAVNDSLDLLRSQLRDIRSEIRMYDDQLRNVNNSSAEVQGKIGKLEAQMKELRDKKTRSEANMIQHQKKYDASVEELEKAKEKLRKCSEELQKMRDDRTSIRERITDIAPADLQNALNESRNAVYQLTEQVSALINENATISSERSGFENRKELLEGNIKDLLERIETNKTNMEINEKGIEDQNVVLTSLVKIETELESGLKDLRDERDEYREKRTKLEGEQDNLRSKIEAKEASTISTQSAIGISQANLLQIDEEIKQIDFQVEMPLPSESEIRRTIKSCEDMMSNIGNVNLRAIEDYDERKTRYDTLLEDTGKLEVQIKELTELMISLNAEKKGLFMKTYDGIDVNFRKIYADLSGGGEAYMKLEDPEDPFSGGLLINAKPRNGKLLRLEALSGGEKSLTALAFIFAIQEFQPSPFYVLDEVDMFLDSVNAEMVAKRVRESSAKAQFIQVSLRKVTLALAEHLIGVARQPNGISKVIMQPDFAEVAKYEEEALSSVNEDSKE